MRVLGRGTNHAKRMLNTDVTIFILPLNYFILSSCLKAF